MGDARTATALTMALGDGDRGDARNEDAWAPRERTVQLSGPRAAVVEPSGSWSRITLRG